MFLALIPAVRQRICDVPFMRATCVSIGFERTCYKTVEIKNQLNYYSGEIEIQATSEAEAKAAILRHAERDATKRICSTPTTNVRQLKSVSIAPDTELDCRMEAGKYQCKADGFTICTWDDLRKLTGKDCL
jgi:hypothetical protein